MQRIRTSFRLMAQSYRVLMQDKELMLLPVLSGLCIIAVCASFLVPLGLTDPAALDSFYGFLEVDVEVNKTHAVWGRYPVLPERKLFGRRSFGGFNREMERNEASFYRAHGLRYDMPTEQQKATAALDFGAYSQGRRKDKGRDKGKKR